MDFSIEIVISGRVQGVGFRPFIWRLARRFGLSGFVLNNTFGVLIVTKCTKTLQSSFLAAIKAEAPPLARISQIEVRPFSGRIEPGFFIRESDGGSGITEVAPDFATCPECRAEMSDSNARRHRYAFTNCTHCGPRLTIVHALPYDRARTTMAGFALCRDCSTEYANPDDRRFHAEPIACPACGPRLTLTRWASRLSVPNDPIAGAQAALKAGEIIAIKALGGYQLACDATNSAAVDRLRAAKQRDGKPFALMARDSATVDKWALVSPVEQEALHSREAPIVLLDARPGQGLAPAIAPGLDTLGFMLPSNPLQILLFEALDGPLVMTSGNLSGDPQIFEDQAAQDQLGAIAGFALNHDRAIAQRIDDSVVRVMAGKVRLIRRARGYAPAALPLPRGFEAAPDILAFGADLKATFCLVTAGQAILSAHQGDLESAEATADFGRNISLYKALYCFNPELLVADLHEGYVSTRHAQREAEASGLPMEKVQHHHAHIASVMGENLVPRDEHVLGVALDGLGLGDDGTLWGAEVLYGDYAAMRRIGGLLPSPLPGGDAASREPWRNLFAALEQHLSWAEARQLLAQSPILEQLEAKPLAMLRKMMASGLNAPLSSSCGRLFDAAASAIGCAFERQRFEGEAAMHLERLCGGAAAGEGYPFHLQDRGGVLALDPAPFWRALLNDVGTGRSQNEMARDVHAGLASAFTQLVQQLCLRFDERPRVALSGGSFQNRVLFEGMIARLETAGFEVLTHAALPPNDGGIAFGQALVAAARASAKP